MSTSRPTGRPAPHRRVRLLAGAAGALAVEIFLYRSYLDGDGSFHWFTHFFAGTSLALVVMTLVTLRRQKPVPLPLLWLLLGHLLAMGPDLLFVHEVAHQPWMDVFVAHNASHFISGRNVTWYLIFLACLAAYLLVLPGRSRLHQAAAGTEAPVTASVDLVPAGHRARRRLGHGWNRGTERPPGHPGVHGCPPAGWPGRGRLWSTPGVPTVIDDVVAVADVTAAIKLLEREDCEMSNVSVLGKGMTTERHIFGFAASTAHTARGAKRGGLWGAVALLLVTTVSVGPAWAHGTAGGAEEGYVFVQQALGHLAHDPGPKGVAAADAKIQEALSATDQEGVDVALVRQAQAALSSGRTEVAQQTLQQSIADAVGQLKPASGEQTGTTVVGEPLAGRGSLTGTDWALGGVSLLLLLAGVGLALWFRPALNLAQLRRRLTAAPATGTDPATDSPPSSGTSLGEHQP